MTATTASHRQSAATTRASRSTNHGVRTIPAAEMARLKRATRHDLAYMKKHPVTNPWLDITTRADKLRNPVHWWLGSTGDRAHVRPATPRDPREVVRPHDSGSRPGDARNHE